MPFSGENMNGIIKSVSAIVLTIVLVSVIGACVMPKSVASESGTAKLQVYVSEYYAKGSSVGISLKNTGTAEITGTPTISVHTKDGAFVSGVPTMAMIQTLQPGAGINFTWDQKDMYGNQVPDGVYVVIAKFGGLSVLSTFKIGVGSTKHIETLTYINYTAQRAEIYVWNTGTTSITGYFNFYVYNANGEVVYSYTTSKKYTLKPGEYGVHYWNIVSTTGLSVGSGEYYTVCAVTNPSSTSNHAIAHELFTL